MSRSAGAPATLDGADRAAGAAARPARRAARARLTTRSMKPCSNRNSERWNPGGSSWAIVPAETRDPANPMSALGSAMLTSPTAANEANTPPVVGSDRTRQERDAAVAQPLERGQRLGQLHQRERALLHPRAARGADDDQRDPRLERVLGGPGDLLADDGAHRSAHEPEVHDADRDRDPPTSPPSPRRPHRASRSPPAPRRAGPGTASGRRTRGGRPTGARRRARTRCPGRGAGRAASRPTAGSGGRRSGRPASPCRAAC